MGKPYTKNFIKEQLEKHGLQILGDIHTSNDKVLCKTQEGYLVMALPSGIIRRGDNPVVFSKYNPYTIHNIKIWLHNNSINTLELHSDTYIDCHSNLKWKCLRCNTFFDTSWSNILNGKRLCNYCAKSARYDGTDYNQLVSDECNKRGYELLPNQNIDRGTTHFRYICKKHRDYGVQESYPSNFITDYGDGGCYMCGIETRSKSKRKSEEYFENITSDAGMIYCGVQYSSDDRTRIVYMCPNHMDKGVQTTYVSNMKRNTGKCPYCVGKYRTQDDLQNELDNMFMNISIVHYDDYSSPITVECNTCHSVWKTTGVNLTQGHGCSNCKKSRFETSVQKFLEDNEMSYVMQYKFQDCRDKQPLPFDFYLPDKNILIEVDGEGHYIPIRRTSSMTYEDAIERLKYIQSHDDIKTKYCNDHQIKLISVPYWERNNLDSFLLERI